MSKEWYVASIMAPVDETVNGKYRYQGWTPCVEWCKAQFGGDGQPNWEAAGNGRAYCVTDGLRWWRRQGHLFFRNERDFVLYCLRWA